MARRIDPLELRAAAEHLDRILGQHREHAVPRGLWQALAPLLNAAKSGRIKEPMHDRKPSCSYAFADGLFSEFKNPNIEDAYWKFKV